MLRCLKFEAFTAVKVKVCS